MPNYGIFEQEAIRRKKLRNMFSGRDIIVNINQDNLSDPNKYTLLSDKDSRAKGSITKQKGENWLNNSQKFSLKKGGKFIGKVSKNNKGKSKVKAKLLTSTENQLDISLMSHNEYLSGKFKGDSGDSDWTKIPDKKGINLKNALFYTHDRKFSYNTKKFKNFAYFRNMKNKIGANWFPPLDKNMMLNNPGLFNSNNMAVRDKQGNTLTKNYTPGYTRMPGIPSQIVKLYFIMNRNGDVKKIVIVDSKRFPELDESCVNAIKNAGSFGKVPDDMKGKYIVIPFMFGYYVLWN